MSISESLHSFEQALLTYGRSAGTARMYARDVRLAYEHGGPLARLGSRHLAPKTKRHVLAACRAFARHTGDDGLLDELGRMKLPPAVRQAAKVPLEREEWFRLIDAIRDNGSIGEPMRAVLGLMAMRGFRCGDVVRLQRAEIVDGLATGTLSFEAKGGKRFEFPVIATYRPHLESLAATPNRWNRVEDLVVAARSLPEKRHRAALRAAQRALLEVATAAGLGNVYPHRLRRTYATEYLRSLAGDPEAIVKLMQHMGWSNVATAMEYVNHQRGDELNAPAERMFKR